MTATLATPDGPAAFFAGALLIAAFFAGAFFFAAFAGALLAGAAAGLTTAAGAFLAALLDPRPKVLATSSTRASTSSRRWANLPSCLLTSD